MKVASSQPRLTAPRKQTCCSHQQRDLQDFRSLLCSCLSYHGRPRKVLLTLSMKKVRRLMEQHLRLQEGSLDAEKAFIAQLVDKLLQSADVDDGPDMRESRKKEDQPVGEGRRRKSGGNEDPDEEEAFEEEEEEEEEDEGDGEYSEEADDSDGAGRHGRKRQKTEQPGRRGKGRDESEESEDDGDDGEEDSGGVQTGDLEDEDEDERPRAKTKKKLSASSRDRANGSSKQPAKSLAAGSSSVAFSREVQKLKQMVQAAGLRISPAVYKRVRDAAEDARELVFERELEGMLERVGLTRLSGEKEIKAAKRRIERDRDMEGIDTSNILDEPRGRRARPGRFTSSFEQLEKDDDDDEDDGDDRGDDEGSDAEDGSDDGRDGVNDGSQEEQEDEHDGDDGQEEEDDDDDIEDG